MFSCDRIYGRRQFGSCVVFSRFQSFHFFICFNYVTKRRRTSLASLTHIARKSLENQRSNVDYDENLKQVRRLAAELLSLFPSCSSKMSKMISTTLSDGIRAVRVQLYAFCNVCMIGEKRIVERDVAVSMYV